MKQFMDEDFLLNNETAIQLYNQFAKDMPIIDYHCHLSPQEIYENKVFKNITEIWLDGDHYKWRLMRANGIEEEYITGEASDYDKFLAWAETIQMAIGNPLYHWTHLELQRYFGIFDLLNEETAPAIWEKANEQLKDLSARDFIVKSNVEVICTTDDPIDTLEYHLKIKEDKNFNVKILPSFRPDQVLDINKEGFIGWVNKLSAVANLSIEDYSSLLKALTQRIEFFHEVGGRLSDHGLDIVVYKETTEEEAASIFNKVLKNKQISIEEEMKYKSYTLQYLSKEYARLGWVMQFHMNALRRTNEKKVHQLGPDAGFDSIHDELLAKPLSQILNALAKDEKLPKTILYSLNPQDNYTIATMIGSFQGGGIPGKMQFGTAWWFNDQKDGMLDQMKALANVGLISRFIGMLTDSRSFLSYTRHEYFRRILCNIIGEWVENGEYPNDLVMLERFVKGICYENAKEYFQFDMN